MIDRVMMDTLFVATLSRVPKHKGEQQTCQGVVLFGYAEHFTMAHWVTEINDPLLGEDFADMNHSQDLASEVLVTCLA